jgi:hypothetical protein
LKAISFNQEIFPGGGSALGAHRQKAQDLFSVAGCLVAAAGSNKKGRRARRAPAPNFEPLKRDPDAVAPIAAAVMPFAPMMLAIGVPVAMEVPVIGMIFESYTWRTDVRFGMPAVTVAITDDIGIGGHGTEGQCRGTDARG